MNLFCYIPNDSDATSFYRGVQPLAQLTKIMPELKLFYADREVTMKHLSHMDAVFIQRPHGPEHLELIHFAHGLRIPVWIDYDDLLLAVPESNPAYRIYGKESVQKCVKQLLWEADCVSVSTPHLEQEFNMLTRKSVWVIPNAFNDYLFKEKPVFKPNKKVLWRGTQSHQSDLHHFAPDITSVSGRNPEWKFEFMGFQPWFLLNTLKEGRYIPPVNILAYYHAVKALNPNIAMVTLTDTPFNRSKSNIAWMEATYAGAVTVGPEWDEWKLPGVIQYGKVPFAGSLEAALRATESSLRSLHDLSWQYIQKKLLLSQVNELRKQLLERLM